MATRFKLICQRIFRTVGDRQEGRDLNAETVSSGQRTLAVQEGSQSRTRGVSEGVQ